MAIIDLHYNIPLFRTLFTLHFFIEYLFKSSVNIVTKKGNIIMEASYGAFIQKKTDAGCFVPLMRFKCNTLT